MKTENLENLVDRWLGDASFREAVRADLEGAVAGAGVTLSPEEWEAVRAIDWSADDSSLAARFDNIVI